MFVSISAFSQETEKGYISVQGKIADVNDGKPLAYSSVKLLNSTFSTIANSEGEFTIKVPNNLLQDSLSITYLGYTERRFAIKDIINSKRPVLKLQPSAIELNAAFIRPNSPQGIFDMVYRRVKDNYSQKPLEMNGFYREIIKRGNKYLVLNEAVLDIYKASYKGAGSYDQAGIYKGRGNTNFRKSDTLMMNLQGGPVSALALDIIKEPFVGCYLNAAHHYYDFTFEPYIYKDDRTIIVLAFNQKPVEEEILFRGRLYIDYESLALIRAEFSMNVENNKEAWRKFIIKKPNNVQAEVEYANYAVNFKEIDGTYYYDYGRSEVKFNVKYAGKWLKNKYTIVTELATTNINKENSNPDKIDPKSRVKRTDIFSNKVNDFTDPDFWGEYNIIKPDESIESIINKIIRQLK